MINILHGLHTASVFKMTLLNQVADDNQHHVDQVIFNKSTPHHIGGRMAANDDARVSAWGKHNFITQGTSQEDRFFVATSEMIPFTFTSFKHQ